MTLRRQTLRDLAASAYRLLTGFHGGNHGLSIFAAGFPASQQIACSASATLDPIEQTVTAGSSSLAYEAMTDQYVYVWKTDKAWAGTCRKLIVRLNDGTDHLAYFSFMK